MALQNVTGKIKKCGSYKHKDGPKTVDFGKGNGPQVFERRLALQLDNDQWFNFGDTNNEDFVVKDAETGDWVVLGAGSEVLIQYTTSESGKTRYAKRGNLTILNLVPGIPFEKQDSGQQGQGSAGQGNASPAFDITGMKVGHAINAAMLLLNNKPQSPAELVDTANQLHDISASVEAAYKKANPSLSMRDIGAASGHAVLNACKLSNNIEEVEKKAKNLLAKVVPAVEAYVRGESQEQEEEHEEEQEEEKPAPKKPATKPKAKAAAPKPKAQKPAPKPKPAPPEQEEQEEEEESPGFEGFEDLDSDVDF